MPFKKDQAYKDMLKAYGFKDPCDIVKDGEEIRFTTGWSLDEDYSTYSIRNIEGIVSIKRNQHHWHEIKAITRIVKGQKIIWHYANEKHVGHITRPVLTVLTVKKM